MSRQNNRNGRPKSRKGCCCGGCAIALVLVIVLLVVGALIVVFAIGDVHMPLEIDGQPARLNAVITADNHLEWDSVTDAFDELGIPITITYQIMINGDENNLILVEGANRWAIPEEHRGARLNVRARAVIVGNLALVIDWSHDAVPQQVQGSSYQLLAA